MSDMFALLYNRLVHGDHPARTPPAQAAEAAPAPVGDVPLSQMAEEEIPGADDSKIYMDAAHEESQPKVPITTVKPDELTAILHTLEHFSIKKNVPKVLQLRYDLPHSLIVKKNKKGEEDDDERHNRSDLMYRTDFLLQDNVKYVFKEPIFTTETRFALFKLVHRMDSDTNSKTEVQMFDKQRSNKRLLNPKEQEALNKLYPHLLNLLKVLMVYDNNYVNYQLSSSEAPEPVVYKMWQGVQFKVRQVWDIVCDAAKCQLLKLDYPIRDLNELAMKSAHHRLYLQKKLAESEKTLAELNAEKQTFDEQIRKIQEKNIGLEEKIRIATGTLQLNAVKLHEHRDERRRALNNLKLIALKTDNTDPLHKWFDEKELDRIMDDMRNTHRLEEAEKAMRAVRYEDDE